MVSRVRFVNRDDQTDDSIGHHPRMFFFVNTNLSVFAQKSQKLFILCFGNGKMKIGRTWNFLPTQIHLTGFATAELLDLVFDFGTYGVQVGDINFASI